MDTEKVMINGVGYYHHLHCDILGDLCERCCFMKKYNNGAERCELPFRCEERSYYVHLDDASAKIADATISVAIPQPPEGSVGSHVVVPNDQYADLKADKVKREGGIGKRSYYSFPNGVEAEDICRYLSFNLGNVVKYSCRAGRKDAAKKVEDLRKAKDYLENEIKRLEEGDD